ncbi:EG45-like domain containing protein [Dioscorea cayenensis subsp. rotundata]|uniref:EG45-like domain containing protein n=1 Tax=Dioscorea cayennensis subsp. rotundata TaxID=55577 RepID=A0AB40B1V4_DIOCR|nr:EG45-like domain containing protein [Dioscorea cayenensis subsp. rotundata]
MAHYNFIFLATLLLALITNFMSSSADTATFYTPPYNPAACGFEVKGVMIAAGSQEIFDDGRACGHLFKVKCLAGTNNGVPHPCRGSGTVVVKLVDLCPSGCQGTIDLSQEAFAKIADPDAGKIEVSIERL